MWSISATILRRDTLLSVFPSVAGRHQRGRQNSNPATTSTWAQYFCITLGRTNEDFASGVEPDTLIKVLFDSGIPLEKLLPETTRKRGGKDKTAKEGSPEKIPMAEKTRDNLTDRQICCPTYVHVVVTPVSLSRVRDERPKIAVPSPLPPCLRTIFPQKNEIRKNWVDLVYWCAQLRTQSEEVFNAIEKIKKEHGADGIDQQSWKDHASGTRAKDAGRILRWLQESTDTFTRTNFNH